MHTQDMDPHSKGSWVTKDHFCKIMLCKKKAIYAGPGGNGGDRSDKFYTLCKQLKGRAKKFKTQDKVVRGGTQSDYIKRLRKAQAACPSYVTNSLAFERYIAEIKPSDLVATLQDK